MNKEFINFKVPKQTHDVTSSTAMSSRLPSNNSSLTQHSQVSTPHNQISSRETLVIRQVPPLPKQVPHPLPTWNTKGETNLKSIINALPQKVLSKIPLGRKHLVKMDSLVLTKLVDEQIKRDQHPQTARV